MTKYLIIDDEPIAHDIIKGYCDMMPSMQLEKNCYDAIEALEFLQTNKVDLIFLDLNMPKLKGFDFLRTLSKPPKVIVTTAYREFAIEGYELNVVDYLLKPFSFERFMKAVHKASSAGGDTKDTKTIIRDDNTTATIFLRSNKEYVQVAIKDIHFLESVGNYVKVMTGTKVITVRAKMSEIISQLPNDKFIQVHRSFAVAKKHIKSISGNKILIADNELPIGKMYRSKINQLLA